MTDPATAEDRIVRARAFADGEISASPDAVRIGREIVRDLLSEVKEISRELHAYKRAKAENDERFQLAAAKAGRERDEALSDLADERAARVEAEDAYGRVAVDAADRLSELERLQKQVESDRKDVALLMALEAGGVDNWVGYEDAVEAAEEDEDV